MKIESIRNEIRELRNALIYRTEPAYKVFILRNEGSTEAEVDAYRDAHPHTCVVILTRRSCRKISPG